MAGRSLKEIAVGSYVVASFEIICLSIKLTACLYQSALNDDVWWMLELWSNTWGLSAKFCSLGLQVSLSQEMEVFSESCRRPNRVFLCYQPKWSSTRCCFASSFDIYIYIYLHDLTGWCVALRCWDFYGNPEFLMERSSYLINKIIKNLCINQLAAVFAYASFRQKSPTYCSRHIFRRPFLIYGWPDLHESASKGKIIYP